MSFIIIEINYIKLLKIIIKMKIYFRLCALCCFIALFNLPITYYTFLRIIISVGSLLAIYNFIKCRSNSWILLFSFLFILFNPILPIYLYKKSFWIPIDIAVGILFLFLTFLKTKEKKVVKETLSISKTYIRDRIILPKTNKKLNGNHNEY